MNLPKKYYVVFTLIFLLCVGIVIWTMWDTEKETKIDTQVQKAEQSLIKQEKERKKEIKESLGVELPSMEEVERLLTTNRNDKTSDLEILTKEYGKSLADYIMLSYSMKTLFSSKDTELERMAKESKIYQDFNNKAYKGRNFISNDHNIINLKPPYASLDTGFRKLSNGLYGGYIQLDDFQIGLDEYKSGYYTVNILYYATKTMTAEEFQESLKKLTVSINGTPLMPYMDIYKKEIEKYRNQISKDSIYLKDFIKDLYYFDVFDHDWETYKPSETIIYKGTIVSAKYVWEVPNGFSLNENTLLNLHLDANNQFVLYPIDENANLILKP